MILTYPTFLIPFRTWLLMGVLQDDPREIEDCARIDGASRLQAMVRINFPLAGSWRGLFWVRSPVALVYSFFVEHYVTALTGAVKG